MTIAYHPYEPFRSLYSRHIKRTIVHPMYVFSMVAFVVFRVVIVMGMSTEGAHQLDEVLAYPTTLVGTLFCFLIAFFCNNCYTRFMDNWRAAMIGWSRINDLALQVYGYVDDRTQACEVLRLMNAANHLCYGDLCGQEMISTCVRRHLLTETEARKLRKPAGTCAPPFYVCSCWALKILADQSVPRPVDKMFILAMDKSIVEWRQQTTLLPMIQMNPLPFPYYRNMVLLLIIFEVVVAFKIALNGFAPLDRWERAEEFFMDTMLFAAISLLCQSLFLTSATLLMPWQKDLEKDGKKGEKSQSDSMPVLALPAEYYILLPLHGHRMLFMEFADSDTPPADRSSSIFLRPFHDEDTRMMQRFVDTDTWKMMQILHTSFRPLAPDVPPTARKRIWANSSSSALRATVGIESPESAEDPTAYHSYRPGGYSPVSRSPIKGSGSRDRGFSPLPTILSREPSAKAYVPPQT
jgi:predicted membrane chloride channel (bestrophin family)